MYEAETAIGLFVVAHKWGTRRALPADICDFADHLLRKLHPHAEHDVIDNECTSYTDRSQAIFDSFYDEIISALKKAGFIFNDNSQEWVC